MADEETPTAPSWFSYAVFRDESDRIAERMDEVAVLSRKRIDLYDLARARRCEQLATELRHLARAFSYWPSATTEQVSRERMIYVPRLGELLQEALEILEAMPTSGALGPVRR